MFGSNQEKKTKTSCLYYRVVVFSFDSWTDWLCCLYKSYVNCKSIAYRITIGFEWTTKWSLTAVIWTDSCENSCHYYSASLLSSQVNAATVDYHRGSPCYKLRLLWYFQQHYLDYIVHHILQTSMPSLIEQLEETNKSCAWEVLSISAEERSRTKHEIELSLLLLSKVINPEVKHLCLLRLNWAIMHVN